MEAVRAEGARRGAGASRSVIRFALACSIALAGCAARTESAGPAAPAACDNAAFGSLLDGRHARYTEVTVCGTVTRVLSERTTRSGRHRYFFVRPEGVPVAIEVVVNVDETGEFTIARGDRVNVRGRFYDDGDRRGIDWTHHNAGRSSWPYPGYVQIDGGPLVR